MKILYLKQFQIVNVRVNELINFQCPHCPKTFVSASFANAHLIRRHSHLKDIVAGGSHDEYRAETEKLHNEIKTLKERLNQTERVIRNEVKANEKSNHEDEDNSKDDEQYRKYKEEISNLKSILFTEIRVTICFMKIEIFYELKNLKKKIQIK